MTDALRYGVSSYGEPFLYCSDNGSVATNDTLDVNITGILTRLNIEYQTGIPPRTHRGGIVEKNESYFADMSITRRFSAITISMLTRKPCARSVRRFNRP